MCVVIDLDVVCLICLQPSKDMHPIFTTDLENNELQIAQQISILSELKIDQNNHTLPRKMCGECLKDLKAAWRFRKNCQAAVTIFQTIVKIGSAQQQQTDATAKEQVKVPQGLQIKLIDNRSDGEEERNAEILEQKKVAVLEEFIIDKYEELTPHRYVENQENESKEFQILEELEELSESEEEEVDEQDEDLKNEEENNLVEYYLTEDGLTDEATMKIDNKVSTKPKANPEEKQEKFKKVSEPEEIKGRQIINLGYIEETKKQQLKARSRKQNLPRKQIGKITNVVQSKNRGKVVIDNANSAKEATQPEVRQVKTRKRKSLSPETKTPKICEICGNSYRFQHALNAHMRRHYNDKPFPCEFCDKAFVSNVELRRHMRVHTGQKPYACQYCDRRFSDFGSRIKHERTHTGERPYHCTTCGKSFAYPHVLSVHVRTHTGEKRFRCDYCTKGFTKKAYLISHVNQHHSNLNDFQVVVDDSMDNSQTRSKSESLEECIYTTEFVNESAIDETEEYDEDDSQEHVKIDIRQSSIHPKMEIYEEAEIQEIVEVQPDEYTIRVR